MSSLSRAIRSRLTRVAVATVILTAAGAALVEWAGLRFCQPVNHWPTVDVWAYQCEGGGRDVVFVGSSRTRLGIVPSAVDDGYREAAGRPIRSWCLGIDGGGVLARSSIVRDAVGPRPPKLLVVELEPFELADLGPTEIPLAYFGSPGDWWDEVRTRQLGTDWPGVVRGVFGRPTCLVQWGLVKTGYMEDRFRQAARNSGSFFEPLFPGEPKDDLAANLPADTWERWRAERTAPPSMEAAADCPCDPRAEAAFRQLVLAAQGRGIRVAVVNIPESPQAYAESSRDAYQRLAARARSVSAQLGVEYLDLNRPPFQQSDPDRWRDKGHMSRRGAVDFSYLVGRKLLPDLLGE